MPIVYESASKGSGGTVTSVTAADTSIVIAGTAAAPTVATGTLDVIAADHPPAADWSNNAKKITGLANGVAASDAAAFGQIPTALFTKLFDSTLGSAAATIDTGANGIPSGYSSLYAVVVARSAGAVFNNGINLRFNNDSGANYDYALILNNVGTVSQSNAAGQTAITFSTISGASGTASYPGIARISIPAYTDTTFFKMLEATGGTNVPSHFVQDFCTGTWKSTAAITRIAIIEGSGGNLVAGSRMTIYGLP